MPLLKLIATIHTHYIHSMFVQDFVSGQAFGVNQNHYASKYGRLSYSVSVCDRRDPIQSIVPSHYICNKFIQYFNKINVQQIRRQKDKQHWNDLHCNNWYFFKEIWGIKNGLMFYNV